MTVGAGDDLTPNMRQAVVEMTLVQLMYAYRPAFPRLNRIAWEWAETLVEIRGTLAGIRGTTK